MIDHFFRKFLKCNLSPEHYTPWTRLNMAFVEVVSRHLLQTGRSLWAKDHIRHIPEMPPELHFKTRDFPTHFDNGKMTYLEEIWRKVLAAVQQP